MPYTLIHSRLARGVHLKISPKSGLEIVVPHRFNLSALPRLLHGKENWVLKHLEKLERQKEIRHEKLKDGSRLLLFGEPYTLRLMPTIRKKPSVKEARSLRFLHDHAEVAGKEIIVYSRGNPGSAGSQMAETSSLPDIVKKELENFFRKKAQQYFAKRVPEIARIMNVNFSRITVRGQQSRWGSCSRQNNLNFNWRLIFTEQAVTDYVIYHELAHTAHHNHSHRFYAFLERYCPDYKLLRKKLRTGPEPY